MRLPCFLLIALLVMCHAGPVAAKTGEVSEVEFRLIRAVGELRVHLPGSFSSYPRGPKPVSHTARRLGEPMGEDLLAAYAEYLKLRKDQPKSSANAIVSRLELQFDWDGPLTDEQSEWLADLAATTADIPEVLPTCPRTDDDCQEAQHTLVKAIEEFQKLSNILKQRHDPS